MQVSVDVEKIIKSAEGLIEDAPEFLLTSFDASLDFHLIASNDSGSEEALISVDSLELTSQKGFEGNFSSNGYYAFESSFISRDEEDEELDPKLVELLQTPLQDILSDKSGQAIFDVFCAGFNKMEIGSPETRKFGNIESTVRPITFYPKEDILAKMVEASIQAADIVSEDENIDKFLLDNSDIFVELANEDYNDLSSEEQEELVQEFEQGVKDSREEMRNQLKRSDEAIEGDIDEVTNPLSDLPFTLEPITTYVNTKTFAISGYNIVVNVNPEDQEPFENIRISLFQFDQPDVMKNLELPESSKPIENLPDDFTSSSLYKNLEKEWEIYERQLERSEYERRIIEGDDPGFEEEEFGEPLFTPLCSEDSCDISEF